MWQEAWKKYADENIKTRILYGAYTFFDRDVEPETTQKVQSLTQECTNRERHFAQATKYFTVVTVRNLLHVILLEPFNLR